MRSVQLFSGEKMDKPDRRFGTQLTIKNGINIWDFIDKRAYALNRQLLSVMLIDYWAEKYQEELRSIPASEEKACGYLYALALHGDLEDASVYEAISYFHKRGMIPENRLIKARNWLGIPEDESQRVLPYDVNTDSISFANMYGAKLAFFFGPLEHYEESIAVSEFAMEYSPTRGPEQLVQPEVIAELSNGLRDIASEMGWFRLWEVITSVWPLTRTHKLGRHFLPICRMITSRFPPPKEGKFWLDISLGSGINYVFREPVGPEVRYTLPSVSLSAMILLCFICFDSGRWNDIPSVARWLKTKQNKDGSWNNLIISTSSEKRRVCGRYGEEGRELYEDSKYLATCLAATVIKKTLLDVDGAVADSVRRWFLKNQRYDGSWRFTSLACCDSTTLVLETLDLLALPIQEAFSFPLVHELETCSTTGLPRVDYLLKIEGPLFSLACPPQLSLSYAFMDLGEFGKRINNKYGHEVGNEVLQTLGKALWNHLSHVSMVVRFGGDEFVILFKPGVLMDDVESICRQLDNRWKSSKLSKIQWADWPFIRMGVAHYPSQVSNLKELKECAESRCRTLKGEYPDEKISKLLLNFG